MNTFPNSEPTSLPSIELEAGQTDGLAPPPANLAPGTGNSAPDPPRPRPDLKSKILVAIADHVCVYGRHEWDRVRERPEFSRLIGKAAGDNGKRRFWRWVNAVCEPTPADKTRPHEARDVAAEALSLATERARLAAQQNIPAAPSPAYMMRAGAKASQNIDFLAGVSGIWEDAERLREHAMAPDPDSADGKRIDDPKAFDASIRRRIEVMESALHVMREIWDLEYQKRFYEGISDIIVGELAPVPEIQERVIVRLEELNRSRGMTMHAGGR